MFKLIKEKLSGQTIKYKISKGQSIITFRDWIRLIKESEEFAEFFINILKDNEFEAFFWEVKPTNFKEIHGEFEFVLVESKTLSNVKADELSFKDYFEKGKDVICFPNLRGDAHLVVPTPVNQVEVYNHLANFVRKASKKQVMKFWQKVGLEYEKLIGENLIWLSTAGLGVYWLHVRIDSRPKYYRFQEYKKPNL